MDDSLLNHLSTRARTRPAYLAYVLARYPLVGGPVTGALHQHLGLTPRDFQRLGLYLRPRADQFEMDVRAAARDFGIDPHPLAVVIRFVDAAEAMGDSGHQTMRLPLPEEGVPGFLAAARERKPPPAKDGNERIKNPGDV